VHGPTVLEPLECGQSERKGAVEAASGAFGDEADATSVALAIQVLEIL
jgi:hypothetical protein